MSRLILLDSNSLINRAYYALPFLTNKTGQPTGAIFGYVNMLFKIIEEYKPTHIVATFDRKAPTFRKQMYAEYKANRKGMPDELAAQLQPLKDLLCAMKIPVVELDGYEADDIIGTFAKKIDMPTFIVTGDRDSLQLIDDSTTVLLTKKGITEIAYYDQKALAEEGLRPSQIIDLKSLMGDSSDNIPGVAGVGEKTAKDLLSKYDTLDGVYANIDEIKGKLKEKLQNNKDMAYLSYQLATINVDSPVELDIDSAKLKLPFSSDVKEMFRQLDFIKLISRLDFDNTQEQEEEEINLEEIVVNNSSELEQAVNAVKEKQVFAFGSDDMASFACEKNVCYKINICDNLFGEGVDYGEYLAAVKEILEDGNIQKYLYDAKNIMHWGEDKNIVVNLPYSDTLVKAYLCNSIHNYKNMEELCVSFGYPNAVSSLIALDKDFDREMKEKNLTELYQNVELPLIKTLFDMEKHGFRVNLDMLGELGEKFGKEINELTDQIVECAGKPFNINSPKQLAVVLFEDLGLKGGKKTKTGYSTNVEVLESLYYQHPIIPLILRYRELVKLKSTYIDGLLPQVDSKGYVHTIFKQTVTATGRLSSTEPNLQNIPVRKSEGKQIRKMYIASEGNQLVCADYSQIELRLMAHMSGDPTMIKAFNDGVDIHATTASQILGVPLDRVDSDMRRQAKAVNFGIIYGISDFGLAHDLGIAQWQARDFIQKYFVKYPKIKEFMDNSVAKATADGYITTIFGRRRDIPELSSSNRNIKNFGERVAMNMPLQGSASDIIKIAMNRVAKALEDEKLEAKLIMQVHDELIVDCPSKEVDKVKAIMLECMQNVSQLRVKLVADIGTGDNWLEAK